MEQPRCDFFARAGFPLNEDRRIGWGDLCDLGLEFVPSLAWSFDDDIARKASVPGRQVLFPEGAHGGEPGQRGLDGCGVEGRILDQKIPGPLLDGLDRIFDVAIAGQHEDVHVRLMLADPLQDGSTVEARHSKIGNDAFKRCGLQGLDTCRSVGDGGDFTALLSECLLQHQANVFFVVDDECAHHSRFQDLVLSVALREG